MTHLWPMTQIAPSAAEIEAFALAALKSVPEPFRSEALAVGLVVDDLAADDLLEELGIDSAYELTGMYEGTPLTERSFEAQEIRAPLIWLFRRAILDEWIERGDITLEDLVTHVVIHELAHHFGWSDDDIARIDKWWE
jgi:predicted Zn-dependent protease with MMP-like domain